MTKPLIVVASHKPYTPRLPKEYQIIQAGAALHGPIEGMIPDNQGENISDRNPCYSELTALYYAWKNMDYTHLGLVHYRRYFKGHYSKELPILESTELSSLLEKHTALVPKKRLYVIETLYSHYAHTHYEKDLQLARQVLGEMHPDMIESFDRIMKKRGGHMFNMFIFRKDLADDYLSFLFPVLFELEKRIDLESYDAFQKRVLGRLSELLLDVWMDYRKIDYKEIGLYYPEGENWPVKIASFLKAKLKGKKYDKSF